jgi:hypothetical protein
MAITADTIDHATLERLVEAGAVRGANIVGQPGCGHPVRGQLHR